MACLCFWVVSDVFVLFIAIVVVVVVAVGCFVARGWLTFVFWLLVVVAAVISCCADVFVVLMGLWCRWVTHCFSKADLWQA